LGKISALNSQKTQIKITSGNKVEEEIVKSVSAPKKTPTRDQMVVASKNSKAKLYHFTWCPGASQIAEENKIIFPNEAAAIAAGYTLAKNCQK
jgi:deoxyribonuclease-1